MFPNLLDPVLIWVCLLCELAGSVERTSGPCLGSLPFLPGACVCRFAGQTQNADLAVIKCGKEVGWHLCSCSAAAQVLGVLMSLIWPGLSLQDFRDAVAKATRQNGKPVVGERILSQILYYLPQLYQLNKDLLRELEDRVAHWCAPTLNT